MADQWYCDIAGREIGPLTSEQLRAMAARGQILANDCVRQGEQGSWVLARQVRGLLSPASELPRPKPPISQTPSPENLPIAQRLPEAPAAPPSPPPAAPPQVADVFDPASLGIVFDEPAATAGIQAPIGLGPSRERRRLERQKMTVGLLVAAVVGLAIAGLLLAFGGGSSESEHRGSATPVKKAHAAKADVESPESLEAREGIDPLDSAKSKPRKISVEPPKAPIAADSDNAKAAKPSDSKKAVPKKNPREQ
jgi:hypothetical protein